MLLFLLENPSSSQIMSINNIIGIITGTNSEKIGSSISLNSTGELIAISSPEDNGVGTLRGNVKIYYYYNNTWTQKGSVIKGETDYNYIGKDPFSIKLNSDGDRVIIGSSEKGYIMIYKYSDLSWNILYNKHYIDTDAYNEGVENTTQFGKYCSINSNGNNIITGAILDNVNVDILSSTLVGCVYVYSGYYKYHKY